MAARANSAHWDVLLDFADIYPEIVTNKSNNKLRGKEMLNKLWQDLTVLLNEVDGVEKSSEQWKKSLTEWKSNTKAKYSKLQKELRGTGGGPYCGIILTPQEERLLKIMGSIALDGDTSLQEYGVLETTPTTSGPPTVKRQKISSSSFHEVGSPHQVNEARENSDPPATDHSHRSYRNKSETLNRIEEMNSTTLGILESINNNVAEIALQLKRLADHFENK